MRIGKQGRDRKEEEVKRLKEKDRREQDDKRTGKAGIQYGRGKREWTKRKKTKKEEY